MVHHRGLVFVCGIVLLLAVGLSVTGADETSDQTRVRIINDVPYLGGDRAEKLDLYLPPDNKVARRPAIVVIHGGGWQGGDKAAKREQNICNTLAAAGFVCATINYRLSQESDDLATRLREVWPGNLHDCKTAVRFLRKNADKYGIDTNHIGAIGGSAGGHLVAMLAVTDPDDELDPPGPYGEFSCRIQAVVPMYGVHDVPAQARTKGNTVSAADEQLCRQASPVTYVTSDDPPALILHGTEDALVQVEQSRILNDRYQAAQLSSELIVIEGAPHSFHLQPQQRDLRSTVIAFFDDNLKNTADDDAPRTSARVPQQLKIPSQPDAEQEEQILYETTPTTQNAQPLNSPPDPTSIREKARTMAALADRIDAAVAPMSLVGLRCQTERPDLTLRFVNDAHLNQTMAYLTACSLYAAMFDRSPEGLPIDSITDIRFLDNDTANRNRDRDGDPITRVFSEKDRVDLQRIAWAAYLEFESMRKNKSR